MHRRIKTFVAITTLTLTATTSITAGACDRGGRRFGPIGISIKQRSRSVYTNRTFSQPVYAQPACTTPAYPQSQVVYRQPVQSQPPAQPIGTPIQSSSIVPQSQPMAQQPTGAANPRATANLPPSPSQQSPIQQPVSQQPASQQPVSQQAASQQTGIQNTAPRQTGNAQSNAEASALQLLASMSQPESSDTTSATDSPQIPQFGPAKATASSKADHVGTWKVTLPGNQAVQLALNEDGSFSWTATKNGKSSRFQGQYRLEDNRLTLVRSADLQQMAGTWTNRKDGFTFKLDGAANGGLDFNRG
jgi:hypothetical protein